MTIAYVVTPEVLSKFKEPFGILIQGSFGETAEKLRTILEKEKPPKIISVGDTVSRNLHQYEIFPQLSITDNLSMRRKAKPQIFQDKTLVRVKNPKGTITREAINAVKEALQGNKKVQILVDGEEDLLTLIAVIQAPENSVVVYGQPHKGIVVVKASLEKKTEAQRIWKTMKPVEK